MKVSEESHYEGTEPVRGLPQRLPPGEEMLWQGSPDWRTLAVKAFHVRMVAGYFGILLVWYVISVVLDSSSVQAPELSVIPLVASALVLVALIAGLSWAVARTTVYTITSKRVVMRFGIALPMTWNIPFARISNVDLRLFSNGAGELVLTPMADDKFSYPVMWPHVQPWHIRNPRPNLRCIGDAAAVAQVLAKALVAGGHGMATSATDEASSREMGRHAPQPA